MASDSAQTSSSSWYIPEVNSETNIDGKEQAAEYLAGLNISQTGVETEMDQLSLFNES